MKRLTIFSLLMIATLITGCGGGLGNLSTGGTGPGAVIGGGEDGEDAGGGAEEGGDLGSKGNFVISGTVNVPSISSANIASPGFKVSQSAPNFALGEALAGGYAVECQDIVGGETLCETVTGANGTFSCDGIDFEDAAEAIIICSARNDDGSQFVMDMKNVDLLANTSVILELDLNSTVAAQTVISVIGSFVENLKNPPVDRTKSIRSIESAAWSYKKSALPDITLTLITNGILNIGVMKSIIVETMENGDLDVRFRDCTAYAGSVAKILGCLQAQQVSLADLGYSGNWGSFISDMNRGAISEDIGNAMVETTVELCGGNVAKLGAKFETALQYLKTMAETANEILMDNALTTTDATSDSATLNTNVTAKAPIAPTVDEPTEEEAETVQGILCTYEDTESMEDAQEAIEDIIETSEENGIDDETLSSKAYLAAALAEFVSEGCEEHIEDENLANTSASQCTIGSTGMVQSLAQECCVEHFTEALLPIIMVVDISGIISTAVEKDTYVLAILSLTEDQFYTLYAENEGVSKAHNLLKKGAVYLANVIAEGKIQNPYLLEQIKWDVLIKDMSKAECQPVSMDCLPSTDEFNKYWNPSCEDGNAATCASADANQDFNAGSCETDCGGCAGPCYCDEACTNLGDCCSDFNSSGCEAEINNDQLPAAAGTGGGNDVDLSGITNWEVDHFLSSANNCGEKTFQIDGSTLLFCWGDLACFDAGDCCNDVCNYCENELPEIKDHCEGFSPVSEDEEEEPDTGFFAPPTAENNATLFSCTDNCGGSAGMCWCDPICVVYDDCCEDMEGECPEEWEAGQEMVNSENYDGYNEDGDDPGGGGGAAGDACEEDGDCANPVCFDCVCLGLAECIGGSTKREDGWACNCDSDCAGGICGQDGNCAGGGTPVGNPYGDQVCDGGGGGGDSMSISWFGNYVGGVLLTDTVMVSITSDIDCVMTSCSYEFSKDPLFMIPGPYDVYSAIGLGNNEFFSTPPALNSLMGLNIQESGNYYVRVTANTGSVVSNVLQLTVNAGGGGGGCATTDDCNTDFVCMAGMCISPPPESSFSCDDGQDNDNDTLTDCNDPDCNMHQACSDDGGDIGDNCGTNEDCSEGLLCDTMEWVCLVPDGGDCMSDNECVDDFVCSDQDTAGLTCRECDIDMQCDPGEVCTSHACESEGGGGDCTEDAFCDVAGGENSENCSADCGCNGSPPDEICNAGGGETAENCSADCYCGNGNCETASEDAMSCMPDCTCGDDICDNYELIYETCSEDCDGGGGGTCYGEPDMFCSGKDSEDSNDCSDCDTVPNCGDEFCDSAGGETASNCSDCVACGDAACSMIETTHIAMYMCFNDCCYSGINGTQSDSNPCTCDADCQSGTCDLGQCTGGGGGGCDSTPYADNCDCTDDNECESVLCTTVSNVCTSDPDEIQFGRDQGYACNAGVDCTSGICNVNCQEAANECVGGMSNLTCEYTIGETANNCPDDCLDPDDYCDAYEGSDIANYDNTNCCGDGYCQAAEYDNPGTCDQDCDGGGGSCTAGGTQEQFDGEMCGCDDDCESVVCGEEGNCCGAGGGGAQMDGDDCGCDADCESGDCAAGACDGGGSDPIAACSDVCSDQYCCENDVDGAACSWSGSTCDGPINYCSEIYEANACSGIPGGQCTWDGMDCVENGGGNPVAICGDVCDNQFCCENYVDGGQCTWDGTCNGDVTGCMDINMPDPCNNASNCEWNGEGAECVDSGGGGGGGGGPPTCGDLCPGNDPAAEDCCTIKLANPFPCSWAANACTGNIMECSDILDAVICGDELLGGNCNWNGSTCEDTTPGGPACSDFCTNDTCCASNLANPPCEWVDNVCTGNITGCSDIIDSLTCVSPPTGGMCFWDQGSCLAVPAP